MNSQEILNYSKRLFEEYDTYRITAFHNRAFKPEILYKTIGDLADGSHGLIRIRLVGTSFEGRNISLVSVGSGAICVLLWSQMHGDESNATMAICDIIDYLIKTKVNNSTQQILSSLSLQFLPMLNPDGAERFQRRTAQGIDMNRDALALVTPEAQLLKQLQEELTPQFGFNLHDQELSTVALTKEFSAIGLLAPSFNPEKSDNDIRTKSKYLAAAFAEIMNQFIPGKVTKYDDSFESRAFGDNMQKWGTSTLLVESGHVQNDREKDFVRKLNFVGILSSLYAIAANEYEKFNTSVYENLPSNGKRAYDVMIRNVLVEHENGSKTKADLGISYQVDTHSELPPKLVDVGDLHTFIGLKELDAKGKVLHQSKLTFNQAFEWEKYFT